MASENSVGIDPPGVFIKLELEARGWSQRDLAFILGQTEQQLNPLLAGKRAITPDMARLLGDAFDASPHFFLNLQGQYDLKNAKEPDPAVRTRAGLQSSYPVRDMIRRGWVHDGEASLLQLQIDRFFEVANDQGWVRSPLQRREPITTKLRHTNWHGSFACDNSQGRCRSPPSLQRSCAPFYPSFGH